MTTLGIVFCVAFGFAALGCAAMVIFKKFFEGLFTLMSLLLAAIAFNFYVPAHLYVMDSFKTVSIDGKLITIKRVQDKKWTLTIAQNAETLKLTEIATDNTAVYKFRSEDAAFNFSLVSASYGNTWLCVECAAMSTIYSKLGGIPALGTIWSAGE
jgi:hypothetical protein